MTRVLNCISCTRPILAALCATTALFVPLQASAQEVTLKSTADNSINLTGELVAFDGRVYSVATSLGQFNVSVDDVECIGAACPDPSEIERSVVWDVSLWGQRRAFTEHVERLAELVDEKTNGQFTLNLSYGGLAPSQENLDGIAAGLFEMAQFCSGYDPEKAPSITVLELPFLGISSMEQEILVSQGVYQHPSVIEDMERWNATIIMPTPEPQNNILGVGSPPTSLASFQDMTIRAGGGVGSAINALGANTVNIPAPDVNAALTAGDISAVAFAPHAHMAFNTVDSGQWWISNLNPGSANCPIIVNTDALNALPSASRVALLSSVDEALQHFIDYYNTEAMVAWDAALDERFIMKLAISDDILNAINEEVAGPAARTWISQNEALGVPAQEIYDFMSDTVRTTSQ